MTMQASDTSMMPMVIAACEQQRPPQERLLTDPIAVRVLPTAMRTAIRLSAVRKLLRAGMDRDAPGIWNAIACRKRYMDEVVAAAIRDGIDQIVVLGAGLDTRALRLAAPAGVRTFEVDLPVSIARKRARVSLPDEVSPVPMDFETMDLKTVLSQHGFRPDAATLFIWEGVTQYLEEKAVRSTLATLADSASGSRLAFTYVLRDFLTDPVAPETAGMHRRFVSTGVWRFGLNPAEVAPLLAEFGWREKEQVGPDEYTTRYLAPVRRGHEQVSGIERSASAVKA
ncbi:SAM-dependent methyltransferase [Nocardia sp. NPDC051030]|uniref:class I SAM-dependent methyltransferase n=1 Tax=Nocardia sp. NPDC051030 TaxID=3155162 RepID=UPI0034169428